MGRAYLAPRPDAAVVRIVDALDALHDPGPDRVDVESGVHLGVHLQGPEPHERG